MNTATITTAASVAYAANAGLGLSVASRIIDTSGVRWVHHALYIATFSLTGLGVLRGFTARDRRDARISATLLPAVVPLSVISVVSARSSAHPLIALAAAPFYTAATVMALRGTPRRRRDRRRSR